MSESIAKKPHLSYSQITTLLKCPFKWYLQKVVKIPYRTSDSAVLGQTFHQVIEFAMNHKKETGGELKPLEELQSKFIELINSNIQKAIYENNMFEHEGFDNCLTYGKLAIDQFYYNVYSSYIPEFTEHEINMEVQNFDYDILCIIDLITKDFKIVDHKLYSAFSVPNEATMALDLQMTLYSLAYRYAFKSQNLIENCLEKHIYIKRPGTKTRAASIEFKIMRTERDNKDYELLYEILESCQSQIKSGKFHKIWDSFLCSSKWCEGWYQCVGEIVERRCRLEGCI